MPTKIQKIRCKSKKKSVKYNRPQHLFVGLIQGTINPLKIGISTEYQWAYLFRCLS